MKTLFIDTHSERLDIAIITDDKIFNKVVTGNRNHSEIAIPTLVEVLNCASLELKDIDQIIVVNGPGSFTGVRIGVTIAKTIAYSLNINIKTITSLEALGVSTSDNFDVIAIRDPKGVYSAIYRENSFKDYTYQSSSAFASFIESNNYKVSENTINDYVKIIEYAKKIELTSPHKVNPLYIKDIEVLK